MTVRLPCPENYPDAERQAWLEERLAQWLTKQRKRREEESASRPIRNPLHSQL